MVKYDLWLERCRKQKVEIYPLEEYIILNDQARNIRLFKCVKKKLIRWEIFNEVWFTVWDSDNFETFNDYRIALNYYENRKKEKEGALWL